MKNSKTGRTATREKGKENARGERKGQKKRKKGSRKNCGSQKSFCIFEGKNGFSVFYACPCRAAALAASAASILRNSLRRTMIRQTVCARMVTIQLIG